MERNIELKEMPSQAILGKRFRTSTEKIQGDIGAGFGALFGYLGELGEYPSGPPFALYYGGMDFNPEDFEMELCIPVNRLLEGKKISWRGRSPGGWRRSPCIKGLTARWSRPTATWMPG